MRGVTRWFSFLILATCLLAALPPAWAMADDAPSPQTIYQSAEWGYLFWWDPAAWQVVEQSATPGADWISLSGDGMVFSVYGFTAPGVTPEACLADGLAEAARAPGVIRLEAANGEGGPPKILSSASLTGNASAYVGYLMTFATDTGEAVYRYEAECFQLGQSDTLLWFAGGMVASDDITVLGQTPARTLVLPMGEPDPAQPVIITSPATMAFSTAIQDQTGREVGVLTIVPGVSCSVSTIFVVGVATDVSGFELDPARFALANGQWPSRATWLSPGADLAQPLWARPGQPVLLQLDFAAPTESVVVYEDAGGRPHIIDAAFTCGGGGGSMPIRVPLE